jgi:hypothetical protein
VCNRVADAKKLESVLVFFFFLGISEWGLERESACVDCDDFECLNRLESAGK